MAVKCLNKNTIFYKTLEKQFNPKQIAQITDKLDQVGFQDWYGKGKRDSFGNPEVIKDLYIINDKSEQITLNHLLNNKSYEKRQNYKADLTYSDKVENFLNEARIGITKRINTYKGSDYAEKLEALLENLDKLDKNDYVKALTTHSTYILKTIDDFEGRLENHDRILGSKLTKEESEKYNKSFKNFLIHASNFLETFSKIKDLETPKIDGLEVTQVIKKLKETENRVTELQNRVKAEIESEVRKTLEELITNPEVRKGVMDFLSAQVDESKSQLLLDALGDSHVPFLAAVDKFYKLAMSDKDDEVKKMQRDWDKFVKEKGGEVGFNAFLDRVLEKKEGKKTGRFIQPYQEAYYDKLFEFTDDLKVLKNAGKTDTDEYKNLLNSYYTWKSENTEQKFKQSYYDALNLLTPDAREAKSRIDEQKSAILLKGNENLTSDDFYTLRDLEKEMRQLKSIVNKDETLKTGKDLEIANSLFQYSKELNKFYHTTGISQKAFDEAKKEAEEKGGEFLEQFLHFNTSEQYSDRFWEKFKEITSRLPKTQEIEEIEDKVKQLLIGYKNELGEVQIAQVPEDIIKQVEELQKLKKELKTEINKTVNQNIRKKIAKEFNALVAYVPSSHYLKVLAGKKSQVEYGDITQEDFDKWYSENHYTDPYSEEVVPNSMWTKIRPRNPNFIERKPNSRWKITDIKPEFLNPNFKLDNSGYPLPKEQWKNAEYESLPVEDKTGLDKIQDILLYLVDHTKDNIIRKGFLPSIPELQGKKTAKESNREKIVNEADEIVKFIPFKYIKTLIKTELPKVTEGMTDEEVSKVQEERKKLQSENKLYHAESISYDLAKNMNTFINTALTSKYKNKIEADVKLFSEISKQLKIKKTNPKGDTYYDKLKSIATGNKEEHIIGGIGSNTEKHFKEWLDGVFYEDFELDEGHITNITDKIQSFTSLRALGFNVLSGINNKLIGNIQGRIESSGGRYFNYKDYRFARNIYTKNMLTMFADRDKKESSNFLTAYIKDMDILVSQDELSNKPDGRMQTLLHKAKMLKDTAYFMQHIGEHQIQNSTLIAMSKSHRIVDGELMSFNEFYEKKKIPLNIDEKMSTEEMFKIMDNNHNLKTALIEEFEGYTSLIDAYELKDGYIKLKDGINLSNRTIQEFKIRVIGINQRLHGIYNTEDAGTMQRYALGRLAIQFRKWMRPGWNRRFGAKFGKKLYNERVRDYEEGMYVSFAKYISNPFITNYKEFRSHQENIALAAFKSIFKGFKDLVFNSKIRWHSLTEMEKANVKKSAWEMTFLMAVIGLGFMIKNIKGDGDDDDLKGKLLTGMLYECDRLFGELTTFTPMGVVREGGRLFKSPSPVFNTLEDITKLSGAIFLYPFRDEEERTFKTGIYHGQDRVGIYLKDMIPVYNQVQRLLFLSENNQRYNMFR